MIETMIDYMQYSVVLDERFYHHSFKLEKSFMPNYERMYRLNHGQTVHFGHHNSDKALVIYTGKACQSAYFEGFTPQQIIATELSAGATFTRIDVAIDDYIDETLYTPSEFLSSLLTNDVVSSFAEYRPTVISSLEIASGEHLRAETVTLGDIPKRARKGMFRCYDKGLEMLGIPDIISRFECEFRRDNAPVVAKKIANGDDLRAIVRDKIDIPKDLEFQRILGEAETTPIRRGKAYENEINEDIARRWHWLLNQVAPTLGKTIADSVFNDFSVQSYNDFTEIVRHEYNKRMSELSGIPLSDIVSGESD